MRVVGGAAKGVRLGAVPAGTRPLSDRAREGLFSSLGSLVQDSRVLDLFAGTGAVGIEALSRGASQAVLVDSRPAAIAAVRDNLKRTGLRRGARVLRRDVGRVLRSELGQFDLVLLDPPYAANGPWLDALLGEIAGQGLLAPGARVILTRRSKSYMPVVPVEWRSDRQLSYGDSVILVFRT